MTTYRNIVRDGLWSNNVGLVQLLGLCPLLAVTGTLINGLGLGLATLLTLVTSNVIVSLIRKLIRPEVRIPVFVLVIASVVTVIELTMSAYLYDLYGNNTKVQAFDAWVFDPSLAGQDRDTAFEYDFDANPFIRLER